MPTNEQFRGPQLHVMIFMGQGRGHTSVSTYGSIPLTPKRLKLLKQLVGSAQWREQRPQKQVTWEHVEELVAKHSQEDG